MFLMKFVNSIDKLEGREGATKSKELPNRFFF